MSVERDSLIEDFRQLGEASGGPDRDKFVVTEISDQIDHRLGADTLGRPALLLDLEEEEASTAGKYPLRLENVALRYGVQTRVIAGSGGEEGKVFTILQCLSDDRGLQKYFLTIVAALLETLPASPQIQDVSTRVDTLVRLFQSVGRTGIQSAQGLWGELFVISKARGPKEVLAAWFSEVDETYDLAAGRERAEVKTFRGPVRSHVFGHSQLHSPSGTRTVIASLQVERSSGGASLGDLVDRIAEQTTIAGDEELQFHEQVARRLGDKYAAAIQKEFDVELAEDTYSFFDPKDIPRFPRKLPEGVSDAQYRSDLSNLEPVTLPVGENLFRFLEPRTY